MTQRLVELSRGENEFRFKTNGFNRDMSLASGNQAITNVGFKPSSLILYASQPNVAGTTCWGMHGGITSGNLRDQYLGVNGAYAINTVGAVINIRKNAGDTDGYYGTIVSFDPLGFTIAWTRVGTPTGSFSLNYLAFR